MNRERLIELRDHLERIPDSEFYYGHYWDGLCGCVAGHCCVMIGVPTDWAAARAGQYLGLKPEENYFLFFSNNWRAQRSDAVNRLQFMIDGKDIKYYSFERESYGSNPSARTVAASS